MRKEELYFSQECSGIENPYVQCGRKIFSCNFVDLNSSLHILGYKLGDLE